MGLSAHTVFSAVLLSTVLATGCKKSGDPSGTPEPTEPVAASSDASADPASEAAPEPTVAPRKTMEERVTEAVALTTTGKEPDLLRARQLLEAIVDEDRDQVLAQLNLGVVRHKLGDLEGAATALSRVTRSEPDLAEGWLYLGQVELGDVDTALRRFRRGIDRDPDNLELRIAMVAALRRAGRPEEAVEAAKEALFINARSLPLYNHMGLAHAELGERDLARFVFEKAETIPGAEANAVIQANFGWLLYEQGERYAAQKRLEAAVEADPDYVPGLVYLARIHMADHAWDKALPLLEEASRRAERNADLLNDLGLALRGVGRFEDARASFERALELDRDDPKPLFNLGIVLGDDLKDYEAAIVSFESYIDAGGAEAELAQEYIVQVEREQRRAKRRRRDEEERKQREAERAERERLLQEAEEAYDDEQGGETSEETPTAPPAEDSPWGPTGGGELFDSRGVR